MGFRRSPETTTRQGRTSRAVREYAPFHAGPQPPLPRRPKGGLGARAGLASRDHEARWGALLYNSLAAPTDIPWASGGESMSLPAKLPLRGRSESQGSRRSRGTRPSSITPATTEDPGSSALGTVGVEGHRQPPARLVRLAGSARERYLRPPRDSPALRLPSFWRERDPCGVRCAPWPWPARSRGPG